MQLYITSYLLRIGHGVLYCSGSNIKNQRMIHSAVPFLLCLVETIKTEPKPLFKAQTSPAWLNIVEENKGFSRTLFGASYS